MCAVRSNPPMLSDDSPPPPAPFPEDGDLIGWCTGQVDGSTPRAALECLSHFYEEITLKRGC